MMETWELFALLGVYLVPAIFFSIPWVWGIKPGEPAALATPVLGFFWPLTIPGALLVYATYRADEFLRNRFG